MAHKVATGNDPPTARPRRPWRARRPTALRLALTPEQQAARDEARDKGRRSAALHVQLTPDEKAEITQRAKKTGNRVSDFARIVLLSDLKQPAPPIHDPEAIRALVFQLAKIGTNLNQLTKLAHEFRALPEMAAFQEVHGLIVAAIGKVLPR